MDVTFKDAGGSRVGFIIGDDVKDTGGNRVGFIIGNDIKDSGGTRIGYLNGTDFKDAAGNRVGFINGTDIKDVNGNRVGYPETSASDIQMCAAGLLLFNLGYAASSSNETSSYRGSTSSSSQGEESNFVIVLKTIAFLLIHLWYFLKAPFVQISGIKDGETAFRGEWWATCLRALTYGFLFYGFPISLLAEGGSLDMEFILVIFGFGAIALFWVLLPMVFVSIRRVRDAGIPWWWALIPLANFVICGFFPTK
jgi:hypothetical protein